MMNAHSASLRGMMPGCLLLVLGLVFPQAKAAAQDLPLRFSSNVSCITSNFNGTAIAPGDFIWFNAVFKAQGLSEESPAEIAISHSSISFTNEDGEVFNLSVPDSVIVLDPHAEEAGVLFDGSAWMATTPSAQQLAGNIFLDGTSFQAPEKIRGVHSAQWCGIFSSDTASATVNWQWAAAVYKSFSADNNDLDVKPVDDNHASRFQNSDHAGTPENFRDFVVGGARGGGGSNFTGSYSGTGFSGELQQRGGRRPHGGD